MIEKKKEELITDSAEAAIYEKSMKKDVHRNFVPAALLKKRLWHRCFPVNFAKFLRTPFLQNTSGKLPLTLELPTFQTGQFSGKTS